MSIHSSPLGRAGLKDTGGMSTYLRGLSRALGEAGREVDLFTRAAGPEETGLFKIAPGVRLVLFDDGLGPMAKEELYHCRENIAGAIEDFCRRDGALYRFIFSHYWISGAVGRILQEKWKLPHLVMFHTLGRAKNEACSGEKEPLVRIREEENLARGADLVVAAARGEIKRLAHYYGLPPEKTVLLPCGIDRGLFRPYEQKVARARIGAGEEKIILAAGRIEPVKGYDLLIEAAALLPAANKYKVLILGGDDAGRAEILRLQKKAQALGPAGRLEFAGTVDHEEMPLYYSAANLTVLPSYYESFGLVALEAAACGAPVVAGPVGIVPELAARFTGQESAQVCLVEERSPRRWAAAMDRILKNPPPLRPDRIAQALAPFSWPEAAAALIRFSP